MCACPSHMGRRKFLAFALLEVLVALFVLSLGLLGITGMQLSALKHVQAAHQHSLATIQLESLLERLLVNQDPRMQLNEQADWNTQNQRLLPQGQGEFQCAGNHCLATIHWGHQQEYSLSLSD